MKKNSTDFAQLVTKFLTEYLPLKRNFSKNTILSYKDCLKLFIVFLTDERGININKFKMSNFNRDIVIEFMEWLRSSKQSSSSTANQRLAAIKTFANFAQYESVEWISNLQEINSIKSKKIFERKEVNFLTENQIKLLINSPDINTSNGFRHKFVLCLLYDTAARVQELCDLTIGDISLGADPKVKLHGKGNKIRIIPISKDMAQLFSTYMDRYLGGSRIQSQPLITNKNRQKMMRDGMEYILKKYSKIINENDPTFPKKVHPHMLRHSKAMHMLSAEIPIVYIRDFLGHEDISTTMIYAKADNALKTKAINKLAPKLVEESEFPDWTKDLELLDFLNNFK